MGLRLAIAGATGLVGQELLRIISATPSQIAELGLYASAASAGTTQQWLGKTWEVADLADCNFNEFDAAFFCVGDELSQLHVPRALDAGCIVVDKSNAFRMAPEVPLVVAGVNNGAVRADSRLVANPNCSTIILTHALEPLRRACGLERVWAATYQSVSGAGSPGVDKLEQEQTVLAGPRPVLDRPQYSRGVFAYNVVPSIGRLDALGRCSEEAKLIDETRKILGLPELPVVAHAVRVPVVIGHSIAVTVELSCDVKLAKIVAALRESPHVQYLDDEIPEPLSSAIHDKVEVGRLRAEPQLANGWSFFISGDNLRLGAALNGWRILELMLGSRQLQALK